MDGRVIEKVDKYIHLGSCVGADSLSCNVQRCVSKLYSEVNIIMAQFGHAFSSIRYMLLQSYATCFYGSQLWDYTSPEIEKLLIAWRKSVRHIWKLPYRTHNVLLSEICRVKPFEAQLHSRFFKFIHKLNMSENPLVGLCLKIIHRGSRSPVGRSLNNLLQRYSIRRNHLLNDVCFYNNLCNFKGNAGHASPEQKAYAVIIRELCEVRDGGIACDLNQTEVLQLIE